MKRWQTKPLEEIAELFGGSTPARSNPKYWDGDIHWVTPTDLPMPNEGISTVRKSKEKITQLGLDSSSVTLVPKDTVLFSSRATIGKVAIAGMPLTTNQGFANFFPSPEVTSRFLAYALWFYREDIAQLSGSTTFKEVSRSTLRKFHIPVPPLPEQKRIVMLLDEADELRKLRAQADYLTASLTPALFHEMFGDLITNCLNLPVREFGSLCRVVGGGTPSKKVEAYWTGNVPWVSPKDMGGDEIHDSEDHISEKAIEESATNLIPAGSILIVTRSGILKHTLPIAINRVPVAINQDIKAFIPINEGDSFFLAAHLRALAPTVLGMVRVGATVQNLETEALRRLPMLYPPQLLQKWFVQRLTEIRELESSQAASQNGIEALFQSMIHRAFNEEL